MEGDNSELLLESDRLRVVNKVGFSTLIVNVVLSAIKVFAGVVAQSGAMIADGVHTVSDVISTIAVLVGMKYSTMDADESHPYGHERIEGIVAALLSLLLFITAIGIGRSGVNAIIKGDYTKPGVLALIAAVLSIVTKEVMYWYTIKAAQLIHSPALKADAWHHRSDALSSIGTLVGIGGAILGFGILDPIASIIVCILILKVSIEIMLQAMDQLIDKAADSSTIQSIRENIWNIEGVKSIDDVKTRMHGSKMFVDVEISVDGGNTVLEGHCIAENVHDCVESSIQGVKHCMVHVNPYKTKQKDGKNK